MLMFRVQKLALTTPTSGSRSVDIVRSRTKATELSFSLCSGSKYFGTFQNSIFLTADSHGSICCTSGTFRQILSDTQSNEILYSISVCTLAGNWLINLVL
jgi:hypothetical protein